MASRNVKMINGKPPKGYLLAYCFCARFVVHATPKQVKDGQVFCEICGIK